MAFLKNLASRIDSTGGKTLNAHLTFLREQMGVMQHHDAVTGTEKQHVADDYSRHLYIALKACNYNAKRILNELVKPSDEMTFEEAKQPPFAYKNHANDEDDDKTEFDFASCLLLNISRCDISETNSRFMVTVYNPLAHSTFQPVRFPVPHANYQVRDYRKVPVQIQAVPITERARRMPNPGNFTAQYEIVFLAQEVPGLGYKTYFVEESEATATGMNGGAADDYAEDLQPHVVLLQNDQPKTVEGGKWELPTEKEVEIGNQHVKALFNGETGLLTAITVDGEKHPMTQEFVFYDAAQGDNYKYENRSSGAYILRPNGTEQVIRTNDQVHIQVTRGPVVDEVYQQFSEWITQVVRIYHDNSSASGVEFVWTVGPIPVEEERVGKEVVSRFSTGIESAGIFYTDSNGREMLKRVRNNRPLHRNELVAINYYPINTKIYVEDEGRAARMAVLTDRAQGATSLKDGQIDVLVHRRLLMDDAFGVGEALDEKQFGTGLIATGSLNVLWSHLKKDASPSAGARERFLQNKLLLSNWLFFSRVNETTYEEWQTKYRNIVSRGMRR